MTLTTRRLAIAIFFIGLFAMAARVAVDSDTFWHLRAGAWMVENRQVLTRDVFTGTVYGQAWEYPAWLSQIAMYLIFNRLGPAGLNLFTAAFVTLTFVFVFAACEGCLYARIAAVLLAAVSSAVFWAARPQIVSFAFGAITLYILHLYRQRGVNRLWLLPPLMALWGNAHPGFAVGFIFIAVTLAGETAKALVERTWRGWREVLWLAGVGLACGIALLLSPYGIGQWYFPFKTVGSDLLRNYVQEWQSPNFHIKEAQVFIWLLLATLGTVGLSRRRLDLTDWLLMSVCIYLALVAGRNIALFALVAAPVLARHAQAALDDVAGRYPGWAGMVSGGGESARGLIWLNWLILLVVTLAAFVKVSIPLDPKLNTRLIANTLPVAAAEFISDSRPAGPMFNSYNWGGYLSWALYPDYPIYVDGRTDLYSDEFFSEYLKVASGARDWEAVLERRGVRLLVVETGSPLAAAARRHSDWLQVYTDPVAVVLERRP